MKLFFATTNANKIPGAAKVMAPLGIEVIQLTVDIPELQAETASVVAREKARWAYTRVGHPVMVIDSALHIAALNGFPGTNVKWVTRQIGLDGYLRLMSHLPAGEERSCWFEDALACAVVPDEEPRVFIRQARGQLATAIRGGDNPRAKSEMWKLFVPYGHDLTLAEMSEEEFERHRAAVGDFYREFAEWLIAR